MIIKYVIGAGLFASIKNILREVYINYFNGIKNFKIDFSHELFPYKNELNICEFDKILKIKNNLYIDNNLKIINNQNEIFYNFIDGKLEYIHDKKLKRVTHEKINFYRQIDLNLKETNSVNKFNYLKKLNQIFNNIIEINTSILSIVDDFYDKNMKNYNVIGIHYRTSKAHNCEVLGTYQLNYGIKYKKIFNKIDNIISKQDNFKIYISTDCKYILELFKKKYKNKLLYNKNNIYMNDNLNDLNEPHFGFTFHDQESLKNKKLIQEFHQKKPKLDGGIQLLIDMLLLSKCNSFMPSFSNLSDMVVIYNPNIKLYFL